MGCSNTRTSPLTKLLTTFCSPKPIPTPSALNARVIWLRFAPADVRANRKPNSNTPLHAALAANQKMAAGLLIGHGADLDAADAGGWRPLHLAAANNNLDSMRTLIAQGAGTNATNNDGLTPLAMAEQKNHREASAFLKRHGAR